MQQAIEELVEVADANLEDMVAAGIAVPPAKDQPRMRLWALIPSPTAATWALTERTGGGCGCQSSPGRRSTRPSRAPSHADIGPSANVTPLLAEIEADPTAIFWGQDHRRPALHHEQMVFGSVPGSRSRNRRGGT